MKNLKLPSIIGNREAPCLPDARQLTIIGGSGAGKTKFMEKLMDLTGDRTFCLSAIRAPFPEREESRRPGSIDMLYQEAIKSKPYMRSNAVSELEKLTYMLFADEFESLLKLKERSISNQRQKNIKPTKLDQLIKIWERIFPDNRIIFSNGSLMFSTGSGNDIIPVERLSQGEMAVLYYVAGVLYAMREAVIYIDAPSLFLHPTVLNALWNEIESLRPDCKFVYNSVDVEFVSSRTRNVILWVKSYDAEGKRWDYEIIAPGELREDIFIELIGGRKPVLFIEGDMSHSIDARLYPLVFPEFTVKPLGSCDKVIETTRSFNDLSAMHHLASKGIVDRDRRTDREVEYLRKKSVMVPEVAEIENFFLLEEVVKQMASLRGRNKESVFRNIKKRAFDRFRCKLQQQAMEHVRHRIKREVDSKIDAKFPCITAMEAHLRKLIKILEPRKHYNEIISRFNQIIREENYRELLKVFNHKPLINECGVVEFLGYKSKDEYVRGVIWALKNGGKEADIMREAIRRSLNPEN
ncbi:MAG: DUF4435 domain-containing protein [Muribaculaceae bacterium]|nr:DUF4435 domain-containing protein [Muribaculaceae bacterium]